jgi:hypothetical protein
MNPLDRVSFDTAGFGAPEDRDGIRVWYSATGDPVGLYYFSVPPDIDADLDDVESVRAFYRASSSQAGVAIIEVDAPLIHGLRCVRAIIKVPQQPSGMTYLASLTLPFRDFSYVLKVVCVERGTTGVRDAVVFGQFLGTGGISVSPDGRLDGWMADPYDSSVEAPLMRSHAEGPEYDAQFPEHPLSRARRILGHIQTTITIESDLRTSPSFEYLGTHRRARPWWRLW